MMNWKKLLSPLRPGDQKVPTGSSLRNVYEQDYDRIIFSYPFRRLQDKTQVFPLPIQDFVHTRLTHSLEVASVGRSLGRMAGKTILERHPDEAVGAEEFDLEESALLHGLECFLNHAQRLFFPRPSPVAEQEHQVVRGGKLGSMTEAAVVPVEPGCKRPECFRQ